MYLYMCRYLLEKCGMGDPHISILGYTLESHDTYTVSQDIRKCKIMVGTTYVLSFAIFPKTAPITKCKFRERTPFQSSF